MGIFVGKVAVVKRVKGVCVCVEILMKLDVRRKDGRYGGMVPQLLAIFFNLFIDDNGLIDLALCGRRFMWEMVLL